MKYTIRILLALALVVAMSGSLMAKKGRKLSAKTYITSAKIEVIGYGKSHEKARIVLAQAMLDSLFMHYGPHSQAYFWYSQIKWDLSKEQTDLKERLPIVASAVAYADSLKWSCGNKDIESKYRKDCEELDEEMDGIKDNQWREYYNAGVEQVDEVSELMETVKVETDSTALAYYQTRLDALVDTCLANMTIAITIDSTIDKPYLGLATIAEKTGDFEGAIAHLERALDKTQDRPQILVSIAYDYIQNSDYCGSIPYFREYVDLMYGTEGVMDEPNKRASVIGTAHNLAVCYNNCKLYDSAYGVFQEILAYEPTDLEALTGVGRYFRQLGLNAAEASRDAEEAGDQTSRDDNMALRNDMFDSVAHYLGRAFESNPDDAMLAAEYALMPAILQRFEEAKIGFARAAELDPGEVDYWISLGDCNVSMKEFAEAAAAYEKVVELDPTNKAVWESLEGLYVQLEKPKRRDEVREKLKNM